MRNKPNDAPEHELKARRKLLKAAVYTPPAILGVMTMRPTPGQAATVGGFTFNVSATSNACNPCQNVINGSTNPNDAKNCLKNQCLNMCINCGTFVAAAALWGSNTCQKCAKVLNSGCTAPAICTTNCNCQQRKGKWRC